jgi:hypothetical protein
MGELFGYLYDLGGFLKAGFVLPLLLPEALEIGLPEVGDVVFELDD